MPAGLGRPAGPVQALRRECTTRPVRRRRHVLAVETASGGPAIAVDDGRDRVRDRAERLGGGPHDRSGCVGRSGTQAEHAHDGGADGAAPDAGMRGDGGGRRRQPGRGGRTERASRRCCAPSSDVAPGAWMPAPRRCGQGAGCSIVPLVPTAAHGCLIADTAEADLRVAAAHRLGTTPGGGQGRPPPLDRLEGPCPPRHLTPAAAPREEANRYEWPCPGDLLHMDTSRYARFRAPRPRGHRRSLAALAQVDGPATRVGYDFCHAIVDDHSRLAYVELHPDERAATVTAFVERALEFFAYHGITAKRLMTDNAFPTSRTARCASCSPSERSSTSPPSPTGPQTNGKVERFHQTMAREWAYGMAYRSHRHRNRALPHWLGHYNETRPHSSLGGRPPISRVHNVRGQDSYD